MLRDIVDTQCSADPNRWSEAGEVVPDALTTDVESVIASHGELPRREDIQPVRPC